MRAETDLAKLERFMAALGERVHGEGIVYLTGGATALLQGWRDATIDVDIKPDPEPPGLFEAIARLKDELDINVELASPDQFIPPVPGWRERSVFIERYGRISYYHYDPYGQALSKLQRGHERDLADVRSFVREGWVDLEELQTSFTAIEPMLVRYPAIDAPEFRESLRRFIVEQRAARG